MLSTRGHLTSSRPEFCNRGQDKCNIQSFLFREFSYLVYLLFVLHLALKSGILNRHRLWLFHLQVFLSSTLMAAYLIVELPLWRMYALRLRVFSWGQLHPPTLLLLNGALKQKF